nr:MAG TPA: hypothetical protein [Caudoviricetes sp.]
MACPPGLQTTFQNSSPFRTQEFTAGLEITSAIPLSQLSQLLQRKT